MAARLSNCAIAILLCACTASALAEEAEWDANRSTKTVALIHSDGTGVQLRCHLDEATDTPQLAVTIFTGSFLGQTGQAADVSYTVDGGAPAAAKWTIQDAPDQAGSAVVLDDEHATAFAELLADGEVELVFEVADDCGDPVTRTFSLEDGQFYRGRIASRCQ